MSDVTEGSQKSKSPRFGCFEMGIDRVTILLGLNQLHASRCMCFRLSMLDALDGRWMRCQSRSSAFPTEADDGLSGYCNTY